MHTYIFIYPTTTKNNRYITIKVSCFILKKYTINTVSLHFIFPLEYKKYFKLKMRYYHILGR